ncbi:uncharacterized protein LOC129573470 isoform X2 [Sitodiplosis mosellana]|uniref:uncharacterized protein LOC129573470 isoform X2 n=1 Tax=Sitodiplosis mosellana TaxID=263140 RepID=UPI0024443AC7|nr:uncharacterized protein LOC129573470 isoform X2 [Sitodiplosis mosellana]
MLELVLFFVTVKNIYQRSLIVKRQLQNLKRRILFRADFAFANEIVAYTKVMPQFHQFADSVGLPLPFVNCLFAGTDENDDDLIVLEDLKPFGYRMGNRLKGLDYIQCKLVLQELGVVHGLSLAAKILHCNEFAEVVSNIGESIYCAEAADFFTHSLECSLKEALFSLRNSSQTYVNLAPAILQVEKLKGQLFRQMFDCVKGNPSEEFFIVAHGDLWINNIMWRCDHHNKCDGVKFIDLQTLRYTSPVIDILHFLYTSTEYVVRENHMDQLIDDYVESLYTTLQKFDVHDEYVPNMQTLNEIIRSELRDRYMYGLGICMWLLPAVTFHPDKIVDLDAVTIDDFKSDNQEKTMTQMQTPEYHTRMRETVMEFYGKGILNDIT